MKYVSHKQIQYVTLKKFLSDKVEIKNYLMSNLDDNSSITDLVKLIFKYGKIKKN